MNRSWIKFLPAAVRSRLEGKSYLQNVISNTGWQFADNILRMGIGMLVGIWVARYLGPEKFGLLSYALAFVAMFSAFANLGLDDIIVREIVRELHSRLEILGTAFVLKLVGGAVAFLGAVTTILAIRPAENLTHWLVGIIAFGSIFQAFSIIEFWFHSQVRAKYVVWAKSGAFLSCSLIKIILILSEASLVAFAWVALLEIVMVAAGLIYTYRAQGNLLREWLGTLAKAKRLLKDSWPLMLSSMVIMIFWRIDQVMLGDMVGNEELGIYSVAVRLSEVWYFIPTAVYWSVFPSIVEAKALDDELFYGRLQRLYNLMALCSYTIAIPTAIIAQWLVPTLFGEAYARGGQMLAVLIWSNLFASLEMAKTAFMNAMNWTRLYLLTVSLGCALKIILNYLLISRYNGMGAVVASLMAFWFACHGTCFLFKPLYRTGTMLSRAFVFPKIW